MRMTIKVSNGNFPEGLYATFCFMLQLAGPCEHTEEGVVFSDIEADHPMYLKKGAVTVVSAEDYFRLKIRQTCARVCGWFGKKTDPHELQYGLQINYSDIEPVLFCPEMCTDQTKGYPVCKRSECTKKYACRYSPQNMPYPSSPFCAEEDS